MKGGSQAHSLLNTPQRDAQAQHFNIGDNSWSPLNPAPGPCRDSYAAVDTSIGRPVSTNWEIFWKMSKELKAFDGRVENFDEWYARMREHCAQSNPRWLKVFDLIEQTKKPISLKEIPGLRVDPAHGLEDADWMNIALKLWSFIGNHVTGLIHQRRHQMTLGEEYNGLELWRALYVQNKGGAEQVQVGGISAFHAFPICKRVEDLHHHIGEWQVMRMRHGAGIDDANLRIMFLNTLPEVTATEIRRRTELTSLQQYIEFVMSQLHLYNDKRLAIAQAQRLNRSLGRSGGTTTSPLIPGDAEQPEVPASHPEPRRSAPDPQAGLIEGLINALNQRSRPPTRGAKTPQRSRSPSPGSSGSRPDPNYGGKTMGDRTCWHCGKKSHSRQACPEYIKLKKDNGGKLPHGYMGAYEKSKAKTTSPLIPGITGPMDDDDDYEDHDECVFHGHIPTWAAVPPAFKPTTVNNPFGSLSVENEDDEDDESDMIRQLTTFAAKVSVGPKVSQKQARTWPTPGRRPKSPRLRKRSNRARSSCRRSHWNPTISTRKYGALSTPEPV